MLEGLKLKPIKRKIVAKEPIKKKKFNFKTISRANGNVNDVEWLNNKTKEQLVHLWKIGHIRKKLDEEDSKKFKEICYYLRAKFNVEVP